MRLPRDEFRRQVKLIYPEACRGDHTAVDQLAVLIGRRKKKGPRQCIDCQTTTHGLRCFTCNLRYRYYRTALPV